MKKPSTAIPTSSRLLFKLQAAYSWAHQRDKQQDLLARWRKLNPKTNPAGPGDTAEAFYGESGKYAKVINPFGTGTQPAEVVNAPRFDLPAALQVKLGAGESWVRHADLPRVLGLRGNGSARRRSLSMPTAMAARTSSSRPPSRRRKASVTLSCSTRARVVFKDVSNAWGLPDDRASLGAAAADFDADRRIDLFLCGPSGYFLLRNEGTKFTDVTEKAGIGKTTSLGLTALARPRPGWRPRPLRFESHRPRARGRRFRRCAVPGVSNAAFRNVGKPAVMKALPEDNWAPIAVAPSEVGAKEGLSLQFAAWPDAKDLLGPPANYHAVAALDVDDDRDLDLLLMAADRSFQAVLNDRLGAFHTQKLDPLTATGCLILDLDKDGRSDLIAIDPTGKVVALRNATDVTQSPRKVAWTAWPIASSGWNSATAADLNLDSWPDLVGLPAKSDVPVVHWSRNDGKTLIDAPLAVGPAPDGIKTLTGFVLSDLAGDALPDLLTLADGAPPTLAKNLGNGRHWLAARSRRALEDELRSHANQPTRPGYQTPIGRAGAPLHLRGYYDDGLARPIDRPVCARSGCQSVGRTGSARVARRYDAMRVEPEGRRQTRPQRGESQDGKLSGTFHVERFAVRVRG